MRAITVEPKKPGSAKWEEVQEPSAREGSILVEAIAVGVCGTDVEIVEGKYGWAAPGKTRLILGHESLGRVLESDPTGRLKKDDLVVGIVRRPDPVSCPNCAVGEWDMCRNGQYTERGIKQIDGFMSERWRIEAEYAMKVDSSLGLLGVLLEPTTVVTKAWEQIAAVGQRALWEPRTVLVTGAGPIGLPAAMLGKQRGLDIHVLDRAESGTKPDLVRALGATYHTGTVASVGFEPDVIVECTGVGQVITDSIRFIGAGGVVCLTGVGSGGSTSGFAAADLGAAAVLKNNVIVGSVNANNRHWYKAGKTQVQDMNSESVAANESTPLEMTSGQGTEYRHGGSEHDQPGCDSKQLSLSERADLVEVRKSHRPQSLRRCSGPGTSSTDSGRKADGERDQAIVGFVGLGTSPDTTP
jgi:threonine dehydrogenase-like Zn-dependent dehydrogenase